MQHIDPTQITPLGRMVLLLANTEEIESGGIILPNQERYPDVGWVQAAGPFADPTLIPGDYVLLESENESFPGAPVDFFRITVDARDEGLVNIALPIEEEPRIREIYRAVQADSDNDMMIQVADIFTDETWNMLTSDIRDLQLGEIPNPDWGLEYINSHMLWLPEGLFYLVEDRNITAIINY